MLKIAYRTEYQHSLPEGHRFPMVKYELIPRQLLYEGTVGPESFFEPVRVSEPWILSTHKATYWEKLQGLSLSPSMVRRIGFPLSASLVERECYIVQGTIDCALYALSDGVSLNVAGGTHHAYSDRGEGFCLLNDMAVAANYLLAERKARRILIIDLDVHQGNGTAEIFSGDERVFTFSMHGAENYPLKKETSDLDIALPTGCGDAEYLDILSGTLPSLVEKHKPDFVFYLSGVDILKNDKLGKLSLTLEGCRQRDALVFECCLSKGLPVAVAMGGGYNSKLADIVEAHCNTFRLARRLFFN